MGDTNEVIGQFCSDTWDKLRIRYPSLVTSVNDDDMRSESVSPLTVYPNPVDGDLTISGHGALTIDEVLPEVLPGLAPKENQLSRDRLSGRVVDERQAPLRHARS